MTQTIKFATFPFTHKGINFVSRVSENSRHIPQIMMMGEAFIQMNQSAINDLMPGIENLSYAEIEKELAFLNEGGSEMFLELGAN